MTPFRDVFIRAARVDLGKTRPRWKLIRTTPLHDPSYRSTYVLPATVTQRSQAQKIADEWLEQDYWPPLAGAGFGGWHPGQHIPGDVWVIKSEGRYRLVKRLEDGSKTTFQLPEGFLMNDAERAAMMCLDHRVWPPYEHWLKEIKDG